MLSKHLLNEPPATGRRAQALWRRERLLDAALTVFVDKGVDGATIKDITAAAGVTQGLLYHYFQGKDALLLALLEERGFLPELRRVLDASRDRPAAEVLPEVAGGFRQVLADNADLVALFFSAGQTNPAIRAGLREFVAEGQRLLAEYLMARVDAGELRPHDAGTTAQLLLSTVALGQVTGGGADLEALVDVLLRGVAADDGRQGGR
jgi:TetR/AcrR family transcriptional regulator, cholesterol catabolism regulator